MKAQVNVGSFVGIGEVAGGAWAKSPTLAERNKKTRTKSRAGFIFLVAMGGLESLCYLIELHQ